MQFRDVSNTFVRVCCCLPLLVYNDQSDPAQVQRVFADVRTGFGPADILINNAAVFSFQPIEDVTEDEFLRHYLRPPPGRARNRGASRCKGSPAQTAAQTRHSGSSMEDIA
jgi:hypothetical protein